VAMVEWKQPIIEVYVTTNNYKEKMHELEKQPKDVNPMKGWQVKEEGKWIH